ncbi:hypothetical protein BYT27DRAFT_7254281 [Phlegmacium glaucopus]|nr:hypothetical protein BYT27DRAFT_7254281 [Phlegmacium glaucopus]
MSAQITSKSCDPLYKPIVHRLIERPRVYIVVNRVAIASIYSSHGLVPDEPTAIPQQPLQPIESLDAYYLDAYYLDEQTLLELQCVDKRRYGSSNSIPLGMSALHEQHIFSIRSPITKVFSHVQASQIFEYFTEMVFVTQTRPRLKLDHCDFYDRYEAYKRITLKHEGKEGQKVGYTVAKPPPGNIFDVFDVTESL